MNAVVLRLCVVASVFVVAFVPRSGRAESARFFDLEGFGGWLDGNPESTAVTEDGAIVLGPPVRERYGDPAAAFSAATAWGDDVVVARVDDARVLLVDRAGKTKELFKPEESLVSALLVSDGALFVAAGPPAKIYRVESSGKARVVYSPDASYVWDIAADADGVLYLATGDPGLVIRLEKDRGQVVFAPEQAHLRSIAYDKQLGLFVGGGERGVLYRSASLTLGKKPEENKDAKKKADKNKRALDATLPFKALYDSGHAEVTAIAFLGQHVFAAGVTGAAALASDEGNEQQGKKGKGPEVRSQLSRVAMDGTAEVLAGSSDEAVFDLAIDDKQRVVVATGATGRDDPRGRLYTVDPKKRLISMVYQSPSRRITHLVTLPRDAMAAVSGGGGRITHVTGGYADKGEFFTTPFDANITSFWGKIQVFGVFDKGSKVTAAVRTGQTAIPDDTWSPWSKELIAPGPLPSEATAGRFMQVRLTLSGDGKVTPEVQRVRLAFLRQNLPPFVREVVALKKGVALLPIFREEPKSRTISLGDKGDGGGASKEGSGGGSRRAGEQARQVEEPGALTVRWVAEDPNGDELKYELLVKPTSERDWKSVDADLDLPFFTFNSSQFPDGHYQFRVRASDAPSNPDGLEHSDTRESRAVLIDNTAPRIEPLQIEVQGKNVVVRAKVNDAVGPLVDAAYAVDAGDFRPLRPDDGVLDGPGESFTLELRDLAAGGHSVTVRVLDEADNPGFGEARFQVR